LIAAFWTVYTIRHRPTKPRTAAELVDELKTINPPEGAQRISLAPIRDSSSVDQQAVALYAANSDCATVAEYYKAEFARRGFKYKLRNDEEKKPESEVMSFCGHKTYGSFTCKPEAHSLHYVVALRWPDNPC
jgi:hypothetical protein